MVEVRKTFHHSPWGSVQVAAHGRSMSERGHPCEKEVLRTEGWKQQLQKRPGASSRGHVCLEEQSPPTGRSSGKSHPRPDGRAGDLSETCTISEMQVASSGGRPWAG